MKKLTKRNNVQNQTIEAYACSCSCQCWCNPCRCLDGLLYFGDDTLANGHYVPNNDDTAANVAK